MGALSAMVRTEFDDSQPTTDIQIATSTTADPYNFYRGALLTFDSTDHLLCNANAADNVFAGVSDEQLVTDSFNTNGAVAGTLVHVITYGRMKIVGSTAMAKANMGALLACTATSDNPADVVVCNPGTTTGPIGSLDQVTEEGVSGFVMLSRRIVLPLPT